MHNRYVVSRSWRTDGNYVDWRLGHISQLLTPLITQVKPVDVAHIGGACVIVLLLFYV